MPPRAGRFWADRRGDAAEDGDGRDPVCQRGHRGAGQRVGAAAGQPDDAKAVRAKRVGDVGHVAGEVGDRGVLMGVG